MGSEQKSTKETTEKTIKKRLQVIQLAESLGNVSEACRKTGIDRTSFYEWRRRYAAKGIEGLKDLQPSHKDHPHTTPPKAVKKIIDVAFQYPDWGCIRISEQLKKSGISVSSPTVQKILIKNNLSSVSDRADALEKKAVVEKIKLSSSQIEAIAKHNPAFKEKGKEPKSPGELVIIDTIPIPSQKLKVAGYLLVAVDAYGMFATAEFYSEKGPGTSEEFISNVVLPFYKNLKTPIKTIFTDKSKEFLSDGIEEVLKKQNINHQIDKKFRVNLNGYMLRFRGKLQSALYEINKKPQNATVLKKLLSSWITEYNHTGIENFPNLGEAPVEVWKKKGLKPKFQ
jgi:transposase